MFIESAISSKQRQCQLRAHFNSLFHRLSSLPNSYCDEVKQELRKVDLRNIEHGKNNTKLVCANVVVAQEQSDTV